MITAAKDGHFDRVLNSEHHHSDLVSSGKKYSDQYGPLFDPVAVGNRKRIVDETEAGIANLAGKGNEVKQWLKEIALKKDDGYRIGKATG